LKPHCRPSWQLQIRGLVFVVAIESAQVGPLCYRASGGDAATNANHQQRPEPCVEGAMATMGLGTLGCSWRGDPLIHLLQERNQFAFNVLDHQMDRYLYLEVGWNWWTAENSSVGPSWPMWLHDTPCSFRMWQSDATAWESVLRRSWTATWWGMTLDWNRLGTPNLVDACRCLVAKTSHPPVHHCGHRYTMNLQWYTYVIIWIICVYIYTLPFDY